MLASTLFWRHDNMSFFRWSLKNKRIFTRYSVQWSASSHELEPDTLFTHTCALKGSRFSGVEIATMQATKHWFHMHAIIVQRMSRTMKQLAEMHHISTYRLNAFARTRHLIQKIHYFELTCHVIRRSKRARRFIESIATGSKSNRQGKLQILEYKTCSPAMDKRHLSTWEWNIYCKMHGISYFHSLPCQE